jgi:formiminotetrahydrofolate cyclodeaminase
MTRFAESSIATFLDALASPDPTPGGGTASAIAGAIGVSVLMMVAGLPKSRTSTDTERIKLAETRARLMSNREQLVTLADTDTEAFNEVMAAHRRPKSTDEERAARRQAVQRALRAAIDAPLAMIRALTDAAGRARVVAQYGNRAAASDVRVGLELIEAAAAGAAANVEINLVSLHDEAFKKAAAAEALELTNRLREDTASARAALA